MGVARAGSYLGTKRKFESEQTEHQSPSLTDIAPPGAEGGRKSTAELSENTKFRQHTISR